MVCQYHESPWFVGPENIGSGACKKLKNQNKIHLFEKKEKIYKKKLHSGF
jgi:hypothetical protein